MRREKPDPKRPQLWWRYDLDTYSLNQEEWAVFPGVWNLENDLMILYPNGSVEYRQTWLKYYSSETGIISKTQWVTSESWSEIDSVYMYGTESEFICNL